MSFTRFMPEVKFKPWIGSRYEKRELFELKILLLAESHYGEPEHACENITTEVVKHWGQEKPLRFFTVIAKFLLGKGAGGDFPDADRRDFWEKVAFYNYVQELVGNKSRIRPTDKMWQDAQAPFLTVCETLQPELIIVFGKALRENLPAVPARHTCCYVNHPSWPGFSYEQERPKLEQAVNK